MTDLEQIEKEMQSLRMCLAHLQQRINTLEFKRDAMARLIGVLFSERKRTLAEELLLEKI